jgi:sugar lactone lactonase YvrE
MWDDRRQHLYWVDMLAGDVLQWQGSGEPTRHHVGDVAAALRPRRDGGYVVAIERGFVLVDEAWSSVQELPEAFADPAIRMNDGGCDPQGRFYCGSMAYDATLGAASIYRLDPDLSSRVVLSDVTVSNGLCWDADGTTAYYVDSATQRIDAFDFDPDAGTFGRRRPVVTIDPDVGSPDGMTIDSQGNLWVALWDGAAVHAYSPHGQLREVVELPTPRPSACTFGGTDLTTLFVTTSALNLDRSADPVAGSVFAATVGVSGTAVHRFAG